ncbi:MAG: mandelate racemase/muconate lactonizing enzyme family protein [Dehalococcoidia bacterium]|nr:mandelate racemase/muconate lactonizing enzyme family protein [Dehalococcoidia bacterium]MSQ35383.1 mandelate racemase/muconate lactonizing enzyme family protein [Dehalococcoidia bacterium]
MKIEKVETMIIGRNLIVRIWTDNGLSGVGQSACWAYPEAVEKIIGVFAGYLKGKDPLRIEHHWQFLYRMGPFRGSALSGAVSAVDIALWDIKGKHFQAPVWQLLGGMVRDRIRLHLLMGGNTPDELRKRARASAQEGFTALKFDPLPEGYGDMSLARLISDTRDNVAAAREGAGKDVDIILEIHRKLTPMNAIALAEALTEFHILFYEDPVQIDSIQSQGEIAKRISIPVANGERMHSIWEFRELLAYGGPQYVRPDLGLAGGITHVKKIAGIAESYHSAVVTHNFLGPLLTAAACQIDASIPNFVVQEYSRGDESVAMKVFKTAYKRVGGVIPVADAPGIGVELDEKLLAKARAEPQDLTKIPLRADGSVAYSV